MMMASSSCPIKRSILLLAAFLRLVLLSSSETRAITSSGAEKNDALLPEPRRNLVRGGMRCLQGSSTSSCKTPTGTGSCTGKKGSEKKFKNKPRVRREWRTLDAKTRKKVAAAFRIMKTLTTRQGRRKYGPKFWNIDDMTLLHACSTLDPRCDQGHYGPQFMTFHRAFLLRFENALLAVDPTVGALPYWDYAEDTASGKYFETKDYIFSDTYFGSIQGNPDENYAVTDGLFAHWPIAHWTSGAYGAQSSLKSRCAKQEWFKGTTASVCDRCCGNSTCQCDQPNDTYTTFFRKHDDCTPYTARNPDEVTAILGTRDLLGTKPDFNACTNGKNINSFMDWQNCIEFEQISCLLLVALGNCTTIADKLTDFLQSNTNPILGELLTSPALSVLCQQCTLEGFYYDTSNVKRTPQALHSQAHIRIGRDILDVTTSPNDVGVFTGYHANLDRNQMTWMMNTYELYGGDYWRYPKFQNEWAVRNFDRLSGPWGTYDAIQCSNETIFPDYTPFGSAYLNGTLRNDIVNAGFPFDDLFDKPPANGTGYTHGEIIYYSHPARTLYTYDTLAGNYDVC